MEHDDDSPSSTSSVVFLGAQPSSDPIVNKNWILLDNQSSEHIFKHAALVQDMKSVSLHSGLLTIYSDGGNQLLLLAFKKPV
jgi:hypothetical protein